MNDPWDALAFEDWQSDDEYDPYASAAAGLDDPWEEVDREPGDALEPGQSWNDWARGRNETQRQNDRPEGRVSDPRRQVFGPRAVDRPRRVKPSAVRIVRGGEETVVLGSDVEAIRVFLAERTEVDFEELVRPAPAGRLTDEERERRNRLAVCVAAAVDSGARMRAVAKAIGRPVSVASALTRRGRRLRA